LGPARFRGELPGGALPSGALPGGGPGAGPAAGQGPPGGFAGGVPGGPGGRNQGPGGGGSDTLTAAQQRLDSYLVAHRAGARYVAATPSWTTVGPYIAATGQPFLPMGGFSGSVPQPTLTEVQHMVGTGQLRYFLLGGAGGGFGPGRGGGGDSELSRITTWVTSTCRAVPPVDYGGDTQGLYRCG
jgi:hypothetical protein